MLNHIVLMGRLTRDPERRYTENGKAVTSFTLAVERDRVQQGQEKKADFIDCVSWSGLAETIFKYCKKGQFIAVTGRLQIRPWTDRDGNKRKATEVIVGSMHFAGGSKSDKPTADDEQAYTPAPFTGSAFAELEDYDDDLPY